MNHNQLQNFIGKLTHVQLSDTDREAVRNRLETHIMNNQPIVSTWISLFKKPAMVLAALVFIVGGVSAAAEQAVPGDPLYAVKVNVNETLMGLASLNSFSEAQNQSRITARRIAELESLAARGTLDPQVSQRLTLAISQHTQAARAHIKEVSEQGETGSALSLEIELISTLNTHSDILEKIARLSDMQASTTVTAAEELRRMAQSKAEDDVSTAVEQSGTILVRVNNERTLSPVQADKLLERTAGRLKEARTDFDNNYEIFSDTTVRDTLEELLVTSADDLDAAVDNIESGDYQAAKEHLRKALTLAHEVGIVVEVYKLYDLSSADTKDSSAPASTETATTTDEQSATSTNTETEATTTATSSDVSTNTEVSASSSVEVDATTSVATTSLQGASSVASTSGSSSTAVEDSAQSIRKTWSPDSNNYQKIERVLKRVDENLSFSTDESTGGYTSGEEEN
ncbi:MAG: hypothetical protein WD335_02985 [Candidatus Paceibacterota bacterium]